MTQRLNGCHDRKPMGQMVEVQEGWVNFKTTRFPEMKSVPFRMERECQYTKSDLGQKDAGCTDCKWRYDPIPV